MSRKSSNSRSSCREVICKKSALKNLVKFTEKHLCHSLFFSKNPTQVFSVKLAKVLRMPCFFYRIPPMAASATTILRINEKRGKVHKQSVLFQTIYFILNWD